MEKGSRVVERRQLLSLVGGKRLRAGLNALHPGRPGSEARLKIGPSGAGRLIFNRRIHSLARTMPRSNYEDEIFISWVELHRDARHLSPLLHAKGNWKGIIAITRGGLVPAALVARELDIRLVDTICVTSYMAAEVGKEGANADGGERPQGPGGRRRGFPASSWPGTWSPRLQNSPRVVANSCRSVGLRSACSTSTAGFMPAAMSARMP